MPFQYKNWNCCNVRIVAFGWKCELQLQYILFILSHYRMLLEQLWCFSFKKFVRALNIYNHPKFMWFSICLNCYLEASRIFNWKLRFFCSLASRASNLDVKEVWFSICYIMTKHLVKPFPISMPGMFDLYV